MSRRFAILGVSLESNAFAPIATQADFKQRLFLHGDAIVDEARQSVGRIAMEVTGFVQTMDAIGNWQPVPIVYTECEPAGPLRKLSLPACCNKFVQASVKPANSMECI